MRQRDVIGVDTGGTFTDLVHVQGSELSVEKLPSTPAHPAQAVADGVGRFGNSSARVIHGTTVALNAVLTGRTARTALVTNTGFRDLIEIGRQDRPQLYALHPQKPPELVERNLRFEIRGRVWPDPEDGKRDLVRVDEPDAADLEALLEALREARPESIAVCLLHAYADPEIELRVARALEPLRVPVTTSAGLLREYREYERFSTAVVNAALVPIMQDYLGGLEAGLEASSLELLQSNGGTLPAGRAAIEPVRVLLSGPAGGVVGAARAAAEAGFERLVSLDMGGTSCDVAFHSIDAQDEQVAARETVTHVGGHPVAVPALDIHTIGCGGGSLARVDAGGILHVGPQSAGADPGPLCHGGGGGPERLTVTDAHFFLGHIAQGPFLGGRLQLDNDSVARAFEVLAQQLGTRPIAAAEGVLEVARAGMRRALGVMTMQRGVDPQSLPLVAFGGAGGLHAAALAASLGMPAALVPMHPGALSALGMATAEPVCELSESVLLPFDDVTRAERQRRVSALAHEARALLVAAGAAGESVQVECALDLRYAGQCFEIRVPASGQPVEDFEQRHERFYGYRLPGRQIEWVHVRARARVPAPVQASDRPRARPLPAAARLGERRAHFGSTGAHQTLRIERSALKPGHGFEGPALVEEFSGTTVVPPSWRARVVQEGHLLLERA